MINIISLIIQFTIEIEYYSHPKIPKKEEVPILTNIEGDIFDTCASYIKEDYIDYIY